MGIADSGSSDPLDLTTGMTLSAWVKPDTTSMEWGNIIVKSVEGGGDPWFLYTLRSESGAGEWIADISDGSPGSLNRVWSGVTIQADTWFHIVATYDQSRLKIYVDGTDENNWPSGGQSVSFSIGTNNNDVNIGAHGTVHEFDGIIDEVRISNIPRTAAWIKASYESERDDLLGFEISPP